MKTTTKLIPATVGLPLESSPTRQPIAPARTATPTTRIPWTVKLGYTFFMALLVPVYWSMYGPTNFLYFCDVALFVTLLGVWWEKPLLASSAAVGILLPQFLWVADFLGNFAGVRLTGMTNYMFEADRPLFLRGLSLFHGWLPFLLVFMVWRLGYDRRALWVWTAAASGLVLFCYFLMPAPGAELENPLAPRNINYVYGFSDTTAQTWMPQNFFVLTWMAALFLVAFLPTHLVLDRCFIRTRQTTGANSPD
jgi:hypothetical protein